MKGVNKNRLKRIVEVQDITLEYVKRGYKQTWIYKNLIKDKYFISKPTYDRYLAINAKMLLKNLEDSVKNSISGKMKNSF